MAWYEPTTRLQGAKPEDSWTMPVAQQWFHIGLAQTEYRGPAPPATHSWKQQKERGNS
jgi:hypothetical protein